MDHMTTTLYPVFWLILAIALAVIEAFTVQLVVIWFSIGAVAAMIPAMLNAPMWLQLLVFFLVSGIAMACTRPFVRRFLQTKGVPTNADRAIGQTGIVMVPIDNDTAQGRVSVLGLDWSARTADGTRVEQNEKVLVLSIEGVKLIVRKTNDAPPENKYEEDPPCCI